MCWVVVLPACPQVSPFHASVLMHFHSRPEWPAADLADKMGVAPDVLRRKMMYWINQGGRGAGWGGGALLWALSWREAARLRCGWVWSGCSRLSQAHSDSRDFPHRRILHTTGRADTDVAACLSVVPVPGCAAQVC